MGQRQNYSLILQNNEKIYTRRRHTQRSMQVLTLQKEENLRVKNETVDQRAGRQNDYRKNANDILLSKYTPPGVVVNKQLDIVHFHGSTGAFFEPLPGKPSLNVLHLVRKGLSFELRNAIHKAQKKQETIVKKNIPFKGHGKNELVTLEVIPLTDMEEPHYLILFRSITSEMQGAENVESPASAKYKKTAEQLRIQQLEKELTETREDMRSITQDQEAANEELQSTNEELLSSGEELQSLNEELETSKEELQSTNEELLATNQELIDKQQQLNMARRYAEAVISTIREPLIILDKAFRIRSANAYFYKLFNVTAQETEGKLLYDIGNGQWDIPALRILLQQILPDKTVMEDFEMFHNFPYLGERTMMLNARRIVIEESNEQLILLAIEDVTKIKKAEEKQKNFASNLETQVKERTSDLEKINSELEQFAHVASHDLQEPLRKISTFIHRISDNNEDFSDTAKKYLGKIETSSERMTVIIQDLLNYAHLLNSRISFVETDLNAVLKNILEDFELQIEEKKAVIESNKLPAIEATPVQMNQLFYNLINNALKFSKNETPPVIKIISRKLSSKEIKRYPTLNPGITYYEIKFQDNGIGFDQKYAYQIFTMFQRLHDHKLYSGTGIGLSIVKKIVENHNGEIYVEAKENEGAAFHVVLPVSQADK